MYIEMETFLGSFRRIFESSSKDIKCTLHLALDVKANAPWAFIIHLPWYLWIEFLFYFLNPSDPPLSIKYAISMVMLSTTIALVLALVASTFSFYAIIENATKTISSDEASSFSDERKYRSMQQVFLFLVFSTIGLLLVALVTAWQIVVAKRRIKVLGAIIATCIPFIICAFLVTIPCIVLENCSTLQGAIRSFKLSLQSWNGIVATMFSVITVNAMWIIPVTVFYPRSTFGSLIIISVLWIATLWNVLLPVAIWKRLSLGVIATTGDNFAARDNGHYTSTTTLQEQNKRMLGWRYGAILLFLVALGWASLRQIHVVLAKAQPSRERIIYNPARADWSGAQCLEMLLHDALAYHRNATYGGACVGKETHRHIETKSLLQNMSSLGVNKFLKFSCPPKGLDDPSITWRFLPWILGDWIVTEDWVSYLQSRITYPQTNADVFKIVCHIRRDDIKPCTGDKVHKYLPNSYYLDMIEKYKALASAPEHRKKRVEVVIHSQDRSWEPLDIFRQLNYTVKLGNTPLQDVWMEMITANVFIMSQSGFSVVPALMNRDGIVVFAPYLFFEKAPHWETIDRRTLNRYKKQVWELRGMCGKALKRHRVGMSGVMFLLRTIGRKELVRFFNPN